MKLRRKLLVLLDDLRPGHARLGSQRLRLGA